MTPVAESEAVVKELDRKLHAHRQGTATANDFILADAKDADMSSGVQAPGVDPSPAADPGRFRTREQYLEHMRDEVRATAVDVLLTSASNGQRLTAEGILDDSPVTLAVRANDSTDVWAPRGGAYAALPSRPFATANLPLVREFCDLVLYSVTFNGDLEHDLLTLERYADFRDQARALELRHFLEVFNPNASPEFAGASPRTVGAFVNDHIVRTLAGVTEQERPVFLKVVFNGSEATRELADHDRSLVVGILGGSAGTTRDTFELLAQANAAGARVSLFGRKVQRAESQLDLLAGMRKVAIGELDPEAATAWYHAVLESKGIVPLRSLEEDQRVTDPVLQPVIFP